jgi:hypothetical protein
MADVNGGSSADGALTIQTSWTNLYSAPLLYFTNLANAAANQQVTEFLENDVSGGGGQGQFFLRHQNYNGASTFYNFLDYVMLGTSSNLTLGAPNVLYLNTNSATRLTINSTGNVGIGTTTPDQLLSVNGNADKASGGTSWATWSDVRLKNVDGAYERGLAEVAKIDTVRFHYKKDNALHLPSDSQEFGVIAQDIRKVFPESVTESKNGYLQFNMSPVEFAMINAIKQLKAIDDHQSARIENDGEQLADLKRENAQLKARFSDLDRRLAALEERAGGHRRSSGRSASMSPTSFARNGE